MGVKRQAITIAGQVFPTKKAATEYVREMLKRLEPGAVVRTSDADFPFLCGLIERHPEHAKKVGCGIAGFQVVRNMGGHLALDLLRTDGSMTDFSFVSCISGKAASPLKNLFAAMREAVKDQIQEFKALRMPLACSCGQRLHTKSDAHVDHEPPFESLAEAFLSTYAQTPPTEFDDHPIFHKAQFRSEDSAFGAAWSAYHQETARLQILCGPCNLKKKRKYS